MARAQERYAQLVLSGLDADAGPVLDVGCGMGGMLRMLEERGCAPVGLTPDPAQIDHIARTYPHVSTIRGKLEELRLKPGQDAFRTVLCAESLQYIPLPEAARSVARLVAPGGTWVVADYFRTTKDVGPEAASRSGWRLDAFRTAARAAGFELREERDMTRNVAPTLAFAQMLARRIGAPMAAFGLEKLQAKHPFLHYLLEDEISRGEERIEREIASLDPDRFARNKRYLLCVFRQGENPR